MERLGINRVFRRRVRYMEIFQKLTKGFLEIAAMTIKIVLLILRVI